MKELSLFISEFGEEKFYPMYRGQSDIEWALTPSIGRFYQRMNNKVKHSSWASFEHNLMSQFKRLSEPYLKSRPQSRIEWLVEAQHYGLATPLLDWSTSPLKALYFAVENPTYDLKDGAVYVIQPYRLSLGSDPLEEVKCLEFYFPKHSNEIIVAQDGCFTIFPYTQFFSPLDDLRNPDSFSANSLRTFRVIKIHAKDKPALREQLSDIGINKMSMYPGLESVSKHIMNIVV
ncbi:TPA: FRG domain-containing protein [Vibrio cholerae]|nr:FRG domain-containing protein [Vibrio cholerae]